MRSSLCPKPIDAKNQADMTFDPQNVVALLGYNTKAKANEHRFLITFCIIFIIAVTVTTVAALTTVLSIIIV